jgi:hypothetical protein
MGVFCHTIHIMQKKRIMTCDYFLDCPNAFIEYMRKREKFIHLFERGRRRGSVLIIELNIDILIFIVN